MVYRGCKSDHGADSSHPTAVLLIACLQQVLAPARQMNTEYVCEFLKVLKCSSSCKKLFWGQVHNEEQPVASVSVWLHGDDHYPTGWHHEGMDTKR